MKRVTVTLPDDLQQDLDRYLDRQPTPPSVTTVLQVALREFIASRELRERGYVPPSRPFEFPPLEEKDDRGEPDVSLRHDDYAGS